MNIDTFLIALKVSNITVDEAFAVGAIPDLSAAKITSGDIAAARMSTNIVAAIAGLDPILTSVSFDGADVIKRTVSNASLRIMGGTTISDGAYMLLIGGTHPTLAGNAYVYLGNKTAGETPASEYRIYYLADGAEYLIYTVDKDGNITSVGTVDGRDVAADGATLDAHGAANHTDRTRKIWIPCTFGTDGLTMPLGDYVVAALADAATKDGGANFCVPSDYVSGGIIKAVVVPVANGDIRADIFSDFAGNNEGSGTHDVNTATFTETVVANNIEVLGTSLTLTDLAVNDIVGLKFRRYGAAAEDTITDIVHFIGFMFEYTADM